MTLSNKFHSENGLRASGNGNLRLFLSCTTCWHLSILNTCMGFIQYMQKKKKSARFWCLQSPSFVVHQMWRRIVSLFKVTYKVWDEGLNKGRISWLHSTTLQSEAWRHPATRSATMTRCLNPRAWSMVRNECLWSSTRIASASYAPTCKSRQTCYSSSGKHLPFNMKSSSSLHVEQMQSRSYYTWLCTGT